MSAPGESQPSDSVPPAKKRKIDYESSEAAPIDIEQEFGENRSASASEGLSDVEETKESEETEEDEKLEEAEDLEADEVPEDRKSEKDQKPEVDQQSEHTQPGATQVAEEVQETDNWSIKEESSPVPLPHRPTQNAAHDPLFQEALTEVVTSLGNLGLIISSSDLVKNTKTRLYELYQGTVVHSAFKIPETRTLGFIGDSGTGKSSVINSLLNQNIARSSRSGSACTCVVTEFRNAVDNAACPYTIELSFLNEDEIHELLEEVLRDFRQYYYSKESLGGQISEEELFKYKDKADRAWETIETMFRKRQVSRHLLLGEPDELKVLASLQEYATSEMAQLSGGKSELGHTLTAYDLEGCKERLDSLTSTCPESDGPVLWPFIKLIKVYLRSPILEKGLILVDMPGLRDLNFARVRATERYARRYCDEVFIVTGMARCSSDQSIMDMKRAFGLKEHQGIVVTRSDDVHPEESVSDDKISAKYRSTLREMNEAIKDIEKGIRDTKIAYRKSHGDEKSNLALQEIQLVEEKEELKFQRDEFLIQEQNQRNGKALAKKHAGMRIFCVSNELYSTYNHDDDPRAEAYTHLSGIPRLRQYCQTVPADAQVRVTTMFIEHRVQALINSIRQWCLTGTDSTTSEKGMIVRQVLRDAMASFEQDFVSQQAQAIRVQTSLDRCFNNAILQPIRDHETKWTQKVFALHDDKWKHWHHSTYAAHCRNNGRFASQGHGKVSWNEQMCKKAHGDLKPGWKTVLRELDSQNHQLCAKINASFDKMHESIKEIEGHAPRALETLLAGLRSRQQNIIFSAQDLIQKLYQNLKIEKRDMLEAHDSSWLSGLMRPAYLACSRFEGRGSHGMRVNYMTEHLTGNSPFAHYYDRAQESYVKFVRDAIGSFQDSVRQETDNLKKDADAVISEEGVIPETELAPGLAEQLIPALKALEDSLKVAQTTLHDAQN